MSEDAKRHDDIYLFVIANGQDEYAEFKYVYKRPSPANRPKALTEILNGSADARWTDVKASCAAGGIDMRFSSAHDCLVFVWIANQEPLLEVNLLHKSYTYFGADIFTDLPVRGKPAAKIISHCELHGPDANYPELCSFELRLKPAQDEMQRRPYSDLISRFPVMFDFVDTGDGISPVYKRPHPQFVGPAANVAPQGQKGHGGIHPRGGSSMIVIE
ncbi:MAG: hypothetical protein C0472_14485 [Erythrobacter sp.]|nr:hypothetical protein [Erythrobacter sp.]MBA4172374.1 hypothetical protein [Hyphomicrobium sp.]